MEIQNARRWSRFSPLESLTGTLGLTLAAFLIRDSLSLWLNPYAVFHFFILSCLATQFFFGLRYAIGALLISVLLGEYYFVEPIGTFDALHDKDIIVSVNFMMVTFTAILLMEKLQRSAYARELLLKVSESRHLLSLQRENDRLHFAQQSNDVRLAMKFLLQHLDGLIVVQYGLECLKLDPLLNEWTGHSPIEHAHLPWLAHIHTEDRAKLMPGLKITRPRQLGPIEMTVRLIQPGSQNHTLGTAMLGVFSVSGQTLILLSSQLGQSRMGKLEPLKDDTI